ncbi:hypothetical protein J3R83DRAFT_3968 [Lanmaoa asiatica]|nr:hypothetical protein J3R83DRAFT_3968 [Lanmaoa asiatica]
MRILVLTLNPFSMLRNDPTPNRGSQLSRATSLINSSLSFIHHLHTRSIDPDAVCGRSLDMDQYTQLGLNDPVYSDWFDMFGDKNRFLLMEREVLRNLQAIVQDADKAPITEVARTSIGVLTTENRRPYNKFQIIICTDSATRIDFEYTGVDGHTVLRYMLNSEPAFNAHEVSGHY